MASYMKFLTGVCVGGGWRVWVCVLVMCMQAHACVQGDIFASPCGSQRPALGIIPQGLPTWCSETGSPWDLGLSE